LQNVIVAQNQQTVLDQLQITPEPLPTRNAEHSIKATLAICGDNL